MSVANPKSLEEWAQYISTLEGNSLWSKLSAANSVTFVTRLIDIEEYPAMDVTTIFRYFAKRCLDADLKPPLDGYYDIVGMMRDPETEKIKLPEDAVYVPEPDELDRTISEMNLQSDWAG